MLTRDELAKLSRSLVVQDSSGRDDLLLAIEQAAQAAEHLALLGDHLEGHEPIAAALRTLNLKGAADAHP